MQQNRIYKQQCVQALFPNSLKNVFSNVIRDYEEVAEIRIRQNGPVLVRKEKEQFYLNEEGAYIMDANKGICICSDEFAQLFSHICRHSVYAFEQELKNGYLTVEGGHRIGVVGQTVWENEQIKGIKNLSALNMRIAHERKGIADSVLPYIAEGARLRSTLLVSPPGCGKTTLLRDLVRKISNGSHYLQPQNVSLIDERSEIASCYLGVAQNDVGRHTDVLDACPKAKGILLVLRSMSPQVIAVDELGGAADYEAMKQAFYLGCKILATIHGNQFETLRKHDALKNILGTGGFERIIILDNKDGPGRIIGIYNAKGEQLLC